MHAALARQFGLIVDGTAGGLITTEIVNWTGHVLKGTETSSVRSERDPRPSGPGVTSSWGRSRGRPDVTHRPERQRRHDVGTPPRAQGLLDQQNPPSDGQCGLYWAAKHGFPKTRISNPWTLVKKISSALTKRLELSDAVVAEADSVRNLLPTEPAWERLKLRADEVAKYLENQLQAGFRPATQVEVATRKPAHGVRPVPYWGVLERVAYRALSEAILSKMKPLNRSPEAYLEFITAPAKYARDRQPKKETEATFDFLFLGASPVNYVVKADITAFYQFIDHAVLAEELLRLGADFWLIESLMELLAETQGRNYGLPQIFDASDMLSEIYADKIERDLLRKGLAAWRFNDDFRIACDTYSDALSAIEILDAAARQVGLVLSEHKTFTVRLTNYLLDTYGLSTSETSHAINVDNVEDLVGDYTDDFGAEDADSALEILQSTQEESTGGNPDESGTRNISLKDLRADDVRLLRRSINGLTAAADPRAIETVVPLAIFAPSLTPNIMMYLMSVGASLETGDRQWQEVESAIDELANNVALNAWQHLWLIEVVRELKLMDTVDDNEAAQRRVQWVDKVRRSTPSAALQAAATRALAAAGQIPLKTVVESADHATGALLHLYAAAGREYVRDAETPEAEVKAMVNAWAQTSSIHSILLREES